MQENDSASFQECEKSMGLSPESQGQRGASLCDFSHCADAALFPTSRERLGPDATQTGCPHPLDYMKETLHTVLGREMKSGGWSDSQIRN